ncbi:hypothetical protein ACFX1Z_022479 [Malus domestica]
MEVTVTGAREIHRRRKCEQCEGGFYGLQDKAMDIPANSYLQRQRAEEQANMMKTSIDNTDTRPGCTDGAGTSARLVSHVEQKMTLHLAGTNSENGHIPTSRLDTRPDYGHTWHPDSYDTQFTNGTFTIAVNGLSLENNWYGPKRIPPGLLKMKMECYRPRIWGELGPQNSL